MGGNDSDPDACATFTMNFPSAEVIHGDVRVPSVKRRILELSRGVDVIVGGPPCQAFSQMRNHVRAIDDPRNSLYREFVHIVGEVLPTAFLMENVTGIDQMGLREQIATDLSLGGEYTVTPQVIDAADVGVPQTRKRLIFIGVRRSQCLAAPVIRQTSTPSKPYYDSIRNIRKDGYYMLKGDGYVYVYAYLQNGEVAWFSEFTSANSFAERTLIAKSIHYILMILIITHQLVFHHLHQILFLLLQYINQVLENM